MTESMLRDAIARMDVGDWNGAHSLVSDDERDPLAMWVHGWLHRIEGDLGNARYWYCKAGRTEFDGSITEERTALVSAIADRR